MLLTLEEAATALAISRTTAYRMARAGELPALRLRGTWRVARHELLAWLAAQTHNPECAAALRENPLCRTNGKTVTSGTRSTRTPAASELDALLAPRTGKRPRK